MSVRPELCRGLEEDAFLSYYYLKEELVAFCRANGLPASGGKRELTARIARYLSTGEVLRAETVKRGKIEAVKEISLTAKIEPDFICSERHRAFFREQLGKGFSFNVAFQKWLKANPGRTYGEAVEAYRRIMEEKKHTKTVIDPQFEYNTYIRAFFSDNPGRPLDEAIRCWKHKKSQPGHNRYEKRDLAALDGGGGGKTSEDAP